MSDIRAAGQMLSSAVGEDGSLFLTVGVSLSQCVVITAVVTQ